MLILAWRAMPALHAPPQNLKPETWNLSLQAHGHDNAEVMRVRLVRQAAGAVFFVDLEKHHVAADGV
jgi:hypothetical protein